jgi:hypothetical protein
LLVFEALVPGGQYWFAGQDAMAEFELEPDAHL